MLSREKYKHRASKVNAGGSENTEAVGLRLLEISEVVSSRKLSIASALLFSDVVSKVAG